MAVTHNPLIAALADRHYVVAKKSTSTQSDIDTDSDNDSGSESDIDIDTDRMDNINLNKNIDISSDIDNNIDQEYVENNDNTDYKIKQRKSMISSSSSGRGSERGSERGSVRGSGNIFRLQSTLSEVLGGEREKEIARMATGGTHAEAALVLAKALLGTNIK